MAWLEILFIILFIFIALWYTWGIINNLNKGLLVPITDWLLLILFWAFVIAYIGYYKAQQHYQPLSIF